jgi:hypothetical protein
MLSILTCFLWVGLAFVGFGDDVMIGASELNDVALKDGKLMLDPDVDGIDASLMLSTNKGLVDIFTDECLLSPLHGTVYNIVEELFGLRHDGQVHVSSLFPNLLQTTTYPTSIEWHRTKPWTKTTKISMHYMSKSM